MSACDLTLVFDRDDRTYRPGEMITGHVHVATEKEATVELTLELGWRTHGRGNKAKGPTEKLSLFQGRWMPGERRDYAFEFPAPDEPFTYHGHYLNVDWFVRARAEMSWKIDPKVDGEFLLAPPQDAPERTPEPYEGGVSKGLGCQLGLGLFGLPFFLAGCATLVAGIGHSLGKMTISGSPWVAFVIGPAFMIVGGVLIAIPVRTMLARRRLGDVTIRMSSIEAGRGDTVSFSLEFTPRSFMRLNGATATLRGYEEAVSGSGTNRTTHRHEIHESEHELLAADNYPDRQPVRGEVDLVIPLDAPLSFSATDNELKWQVDVKVDIPSWPDWNESYDLRVLP